MSLSGWSDVALLGSGGPVLSSASHRHSGGTLSAQRPYVKSVKVQAFSDSVRHPLSSPLQIQ